MKSNVGHLLTAAGAAGLIKVLLALRNDTLPPTANFEAPHPRLAYQDGPFQVLREAHSWPSRSPRQPRRAAVSAFGFGGINAHVLLEEFVPESPAAKRPQAADAPPIRGSGDEPLAVVGVAARFGPWRSPSDVVQASLGIAPCQAPLAPEHWWSVPRGGWQSPAQDVKGWFIRAISLPIQRFHVPPREWEESLLQQALMVEAAVHAVANCRWRKDQAVRSGAFIGVELDLNTTNFHVRWTLANEVRDWAARLGRVLDEEALARWLTELRDACGPPLTANRVMGSLGSITASRIARELKLGGPAFTVAWGDASGLQALAIACRLLRQGEIDQAVVGAVDLPGDPRAVLAQREADPEASRLVLDGAAAIVLKRLADAERDGDDVLAIIPGSSIATAATLNASSVPGHAGAASGMAALVLAIACLRGRLTPRGEHWLRNRVEGPRRLNAASRGLDGAASSVTLEEAPTDTPPSGFIRPARRHALFAVEADDAPGIRAGLEELRTLATRGTNLDDAARDWLRQRGQQSERRLGLAIVASDVDHLRALIPRAAARLDTHEIAGAEGIHWTTEPLGPSGEAAFVFPGSGNHFPGMGRDFALLCPEVLERQDRENDRLRDQYLPAAFWNPAGSLDDLDNRQLILGQVALGTLVSDALVELGIRPQATLGYSLGESTALFAMRAWRERDLLWRRMNESPLFTHELAGECHAARRAWRLPPGEPVDWLAGVVNQPAAVVQDALRDRDRAYVLIVNTPEECVVGGQRQVVEALVRRLGCSFIPLRGVSTVHCPIAREVEADYRALHVLPTQAVAGVRFYSSAWGGAFYPTSADAADAITAQAVATVDFARLVEQAHADGVRLFVEIGPGDSCTRMIRRILRGRPHAARATCVAGQPAWVSTLHLAGMMIAHRVRVDLFRLLPMAAGPVQNSHASGPTVTIKGGGEPFRPPAPPLPPHRTATSTPAARAASISVLPAPATVPFAPLDVQPLIDQFVNAQFATGEAHGAYLHFADSLRGMLDENLAWQGAITPALVHAVVQEAHSHAVGSPRAPIENGALAQSPCVLDREQCLEFAVGKIGNVLGPEFSAIDAHPTRVRLPDEPLMLVDRIVEVEGTKRSLTRGRVVTEHDVLPGAWYLDHGRIPACIAIESGQADLFLSAYLGIDFETRGLATYRLLDAAVTFHAPLPRPGDVLRHDIRIEHFFRQGDTQLFRFQFDTTVAGRPVLTMRDGCAGFFTPQELALGRGIVHTALDQRPRQGTMPEDWEVLAPVAVERYDACQLDALRAGDLAGCFGRPFARLGLRQPMRLPGGRMRLLDRVTHLDPQGGRYGIGLIRAELDIDPHAWFLTCHFVDDRVMPGTLTYECCLHALRIYLMRLGWVGEHEDAAWEPVPGVTSRLKCRGQITAATRTATFEVSIKELGYRPEPFALADVLMYADGKPIVEVTNATLRLTGVGKEQLLERWRPSRMGAGGSDRSVTAATIKQVEPSPAPRALYDHEQILAFATGKPSEGFGERYRPFDEGRFLARLPAPPYNFIHRVVHVDGKPWVMKPCGPIVAECDVRPDDWYFAADRQPAMPFTVLLEAGLQACGWTAAFMGSALTSEDDLAFRNLGGSGRQRGIVRPDAGILSTTVHCTQVANSAGMIIQHYEFVIRQADSIVYEGKTYFGFFTRESLANQVGIRDAAFCIPSDSERQRGLTFEYPRHAPFPDKYLRMVNQVTLFIPDGGPKGLGLIEGAIDVDPSAWFFQAHFHGDPVWPGSLGLESFLQLLKYVAWERWGKHRNDTPQPSPAMGFRTCPLEKDHRWVYRGQILPTNRRVAIQAVVTARDDRNRWLQADGCLAVDGRIIYQMNDFSLGLAEAP